MERRQINKNKGKKALYAEMGKYLLDLSKLIFGGVILASIMKLDINSLAVLTVGSVVVGLLAGFGYKLIKISNEI